MALQIETTALQEMMKTVMRRTTVKDLQIRNI